MIGRWSVMLAVRMLKSVRIGVEDRQILTTAILDKLGALPIRATITVDETGSFFVNGKRIDMETARTLRESSKSMLTNYARRFVREQVTFMAINKGVHENTSPEQGLFAKSALWFGQEEDDLYRALAQDTE